LGLKDVWQPYRQRQRELELAAAETDTREIESRASDKRSYCWSPERDAAVPKKDLPK